MRYLFAASAFAVSFGLLSAAHATGESLTVYHDPTCGCCVGWIDHMRQAGYDVKAIQTRDMATVKSRLGVAPALASCHTAVVNATGQIVEGHVPASAVAKLLANPSTPGVAVPGMPVNSPGMGPMDGNLVTVDFSGRLFSRD